jgi:diadenylate cyclase
VKAVQNLGVTLQAFWEKAVSYLTLQVSYTDIIEIIIISVLIYYMLVWIKDTRAWMLLRGILVILAFVLLAVLFEMNTIVWIADKLFNVAMIAVVVIFQPEMRKALENLGRKNIFANLFNFDFGKVENGKFSDKTITELVKACYEMGKVKTGALIVVEDEIVLTEYERTGIAVDGILTSQLLINIFEKNTPLHDGAVIVRGDRVVSATCYLPLTDSLSLSKDLGTRHRAAVGISEVSDSLTIVVSEETGKVSIALDGELYRNVDAEFLKNKLSYIQKREQDTSKAKSWRRRLKDVTKIRKESNE